MKSNTNLKDNVYSSQLKQVENYLTKMENDITAPKSIAFFIEEAHNYFSGVSISNKPKIGMTSIYIPEVLIYALDAQPLWILGGSMSSGDAIDDFLPRDVDPVVRSSIGYLNIEKMKNIRDCVLFIVPMISDSIKKSIPLFAENMNIHPFDVCHLIYETKTSQWQNEMTITITKLEKSTRKKLNIENLKKSMSLINKANKLLYSLKEFYEAGVISNKIYFFLIQSYYITENLPYWINEMQLVVKYYEKKNNKKQAKTFITLVGSPIYSPNSKIPELLDTLGLISKYMDIGLPFPNYYSGYENIETTKDLINFIEDEHYHKTYGAYHLTPHSADVSPDTSGIVFHQLKGQVNFAFMGEQLDRFAAKTDIPMITIETDYGMADLEQIKIRMEAFKEMLLHK